jgi:CheY-like chemotaxis protein
VPRILLIETDKVLATTLCNYLGRRGHEVEWHVDPQAAMHSADKQCPDAIILDLLLAFGSGIEFLYEFRSYPEWQTLPVVVFSNIAPGELGPTEMALDQLNVSAFHYKPETSLRDLGRVCSSAS